MRKAFVTGLILSAVSLAFAQAGLLGTKPSVVTKSVQQTQSSTFGGGQVLQMIVALVIVAAILKWVLPKIITKFSGKTSGNLSSSIKIEETAQLAGGTLHVVTVRDRTLLLSVSPQGVSCLSDLTKSESAAPEPLAFFDFLDREIKMDPEQVPA